MYRAIHEILASLPAAALALLATGSAPASPEAILPPVLPWEGASRSLIVPEDDPWVTPAEASGLRRTPSYAETVAWLRRLAAAAPEVEMTSLGTSPEGREIWMVVASTGASPSPEALRDSGKPILLAQAGIHAGESDGKDAGLMLLRDLTVRGTMRKLLDGAHFLFIPILNVDGHERFSAFGRINQRGPAETGWRTTARNLNLNRDYTKLDTPEMRALVAALNRWDPDLYLDIHVTDGADYQYDITWGHNGPHAFSPHIARWMEDFLTPALSRDLKARGHVPGPLIFAVDDTDLTRGIREWTAGPRFSNGYGDARHLPTVLVENHSLKGYPRRVLGTYVLLESSLRALAAHAPELRRAIETDRARRAATVPLAWKAPQTAAPPMEFLGVGSRLTPSAVSGGLQVEWTGEPVTLSVPVLRATEPASTATRPAAYWIPAAWTDVMERLALHGIRMERTDGWRELPVEMYRVEDSKLEPDPFEGHARVRGTPVAERRVERFAPGSARVPTDQPLGDLAVLLLEPGSHDSFFQWGFFLEVLQRAEYVEGYVMEPMARRMLAQDPALAAEFRDKLLRDEEFAGSPRDRLRWFYRRTPFFDERWRLYPVARELSD